PSSRVLRTTRLASIRASPTFPTRRSSDLSGRQTSTWLTSKTGNCSRYTDRLRDTRASSVARSGATTNRPRWDHPRNGQTFRPRRSEEHTSELQSRFDLVCRLLLEKKNNTS